MRQVGELSVRTVADGSVIEILRIYRIQDIDRYEGSKEIT